MSWKTDFFARHRKTIAEKLSGGLIVLTAYHSMQMRNDMAYDYAQDANFWYLTGIDEAGWKLVYDGTRDYAWLVRPDKSHIEQIFDGGLDSQAALLISGANEVISEEEFEPLLRRLSRSHSTVHTVETPSHIASGSMTLNPAPRRLQKVLDRIYIAVNYCQKDLAGLRAIKSSEEIAAIERAVKLTITAFEGVLENIDQYKYEYEVEASMGYEFRKHNAKHAYAPIVASGLNACTLHYSANQSAIHKNSPVLIDVGAELEHYCADITRTYVKGGPSKRYQQLHMALSQAHSEIIDSIKPHMRLAEYLQGSDKIMQQMMIQVGLIKDANDPKYRRYFPHAISHGLGIDVHDSLGGAKVLQPGMVITVEPGIYIPEEKIGIRLEDNILIEAKKVRNLSGRLSTGWQ